jgi:hypothetical protein
MVTGGRNIVEQYLLPVLLVYRIVIYRVQKSKKKLVEVLIFLKKKAPLEFLFVDGCF